MARRDRPQHVGSELDDFEDELKEDADEHEIDPDVDEDENEPAPSPAHRPDSLPRLLTNYLLPPLSLDEMRTKIEDDYYAVRPHLSCSSQTTMATSSWRRCERYA
jgi:hypothetical protein